MPEFVVCLLLIECTVHILFIALKLFFLVLSSQKLQLYLLVDVVLDFFMPSRSANSQSKMCHKTVLIRTVPVCRSWLCPYRIACFDAARLGPFIADPAGANSHAEHLSSFMGVPMGSRGRHEDDGAHGHVSTRQRHLAPNLAREGLSTLHGIHLFAFSISYDYGFRHVDSDVEHFRAL